MVVLAACFAGLPGCHRTAQDSWMASQIQLYLPRICYFLELSSAATELEIVTDHGSSWTVGGFKTSSRTLK